MSKTKAIFRCLAPAAILLSLISCHNPAYDTVLCDTVSYADSTACVSLAANLDIPIAETGPGAIIRDTLLASFVDQLESFGYQEEKPERLNPYPGDPMDPEALVAWYGAQMTARLDSLAAADRAERLAYAPDDEYDIPRWEYDATLVKSFEADKYVVFFSSNYVYMGGAHGGVTGAGDLTFRKSDGQIIRHIIDRSREDEMQSLIREGVASYMQAENDGHASEEGMGIFYEADEDIPLPAWEPSLSSDGVVFLYQQYEIAPYAAGMPSFVVPYDKISGFLTPEAKELAL